MSQNSLVKNWVKQGVPKYKLILGIPFYGRSYRLQDRNYTVPGSLAIGPGSDNGDGYPIKNVSFICKELFLSIAFNVSWFSSSCKSMLKYLMFVVMW